MGRARRLFRRAGGLLVRTVRVAGVAVRRRFFPRRVRPPLYEGSPVDDLLFGQPSHLVMRLLHAYGRRRRIRRVGVTVVIVNWNTVDVLRVSLGAVRRFSPPETEVIVIDNGSDDGSWEWLKSRPFGCRAVRLPVNIGHGKALDVGVALASNSTIVTLDSDAFPYRTNWLDVLTEHLADPDIEASGMWGRRDRLHPACSAIRRSAYYATGMSMANHATWIDSGEEPEFLKNCWDTEELVFLRIGRERTRLLPVQPSEYGGVTMADVVFHYEGLTTKTVFADEAANATIHRPGWSAAVAAFLDDSGSSPAAR